MSPYLFQALVVGIGEVHSAGAIEMGVADGLGGPLNRGEFPVEIDQEKSGPEESRR